MNIAGKIIKFLEYKRDLSDWIRLCISCHRKLDAGNNFKKFLGRFPEIKRQYDNR